MLCYCDVRVQAFNEFCREMREELQRERLHQRSLIRLDERQRSHTTEMTESLDLLTHRQDHEVTGTDMTRHYISESTQRFEVRRSIYNERTQLMYQSQGRLQQLTRLESSLASLYQRLENSDQQQAIMLLEGFRARMKSLDTELSAAEQRRVMLEQSVMHLITTEHEQMMTMMSLLTNHGRPPGPTAIACC